MTYYGYKRGDNTKIVDWASVSSKLTTDLGEIEKDRADERQKIEGEIAAANESINEMPVGNYESINNFVLGAANSAAEKLRVQSTLMKNGQLKPSQFASFRQNVMDGIGGYKKVAETYNKTMDELVARQQSRDAGVLEAYEAEFMQNMADLSNTISVIDEKTGMVINAPKLPNGMPDMKNAMPVRDMQNLAHQKYDRFDIDKNLDPIVAKYGKDIQVIKKGSVLTRSSILQRTFSSGGTSVLPATDVQKMAGMTYDDFRDPANQQWTASLASKIRSMSGADALWAKTGKAGSVNGLSDAELLAGFVESSSTDVLTAKLGNSEKTMSEVIDDTILQYNDEQLASVLFDYDQTHKPTQDPAQRDADPERFILIGKDGRLANRLSPELTDDQKEKARATIKEQLLTKLDLVETPMADRAPSQPSAAQVKRGEAITEAHGDANLMVKLFKGNDAERSEVLASYSRKLLESGGDLSFRGAKIENDQLVITRVDKKGKVYDESPVDLPDNVKDFITTIGPKLTGNSNLVDLYNEAIKGVDTSGDKGSGAGEFSIKEREDFSQEILDWDVVAPTLTEVGWYVKDNTRDANSIKRVESFSDNSDITGFDYSVDKGVLKMSLKGLGGLSIDLKGKNANQIQAEIDLNLKRIHKAATTGTPLSGGPTTNSGGGGASKFNK
jgi:hypothetical protein